MVLNSHNLSTRGSSTGLQQVTVNRLQAEDIHHADVDALGLQLVMGSESLMKSHSSTDNSHFVITALAQNLYETMQNRDRR